MGREQARQVVSFLAGQPGAYHGGSGRPKIGICHKAMITERPPSSSDQHAVICPIRARRTITAHQLQRQVRPICGRSCTSTRPTTMSIGRTAPCTVPRR